MSFFHQEMSVKSCMFGIFIELRHEVDVHDFTEALRQLRGNKFRAVNKQILKL